MNKNDTLDNTQTKLLHIKIDKNIEISSDLDNDPNDYETIKYWQENLQ